MAETVETSEDEIKIYLVDQYVNAKTHAEVEEAIDLSAALTLTLVFVSQTGTTKTKTLTADADQVNNKGYASCIWANNSLSAGNYKCQVQYKDSGNLWHYSDVFTLEVGVKLAVA